MDHEPLVFVLAKHLLEKFVGRSFFIAQDVSLAEAGVDKQAQGQRQIGLAREVLNVLWLAIFRQREVSLVQVLYDRAFTVAYRSDHLDQLDVGREGGLPGCWRFLRL